MTLPLTNPFDAETSRKIQKTPAGMASWSERTDKTCRECAHVKWNGWYSKGGKMGGAPKLVKCSKFYRLTGKWGASYGHAAGACRFFEQDDPWQLTDPKA